MLHDLYEFDLGFDEKGEEVISERHQKDFKREFTTENGEVSTENFTDINFDDI